jgi:hypothetical protein
MRSPRKNAGRRMHNAADYLGAAVLMKIMEELSALLGEKIRPLASSANNSAIGMVAGTGFEPVTFRL